jgi:hypothetical protein
MVWLASGDAEAERNGRGEENGFLEASGLVLRLIGE